MGWMHDTLQYFAKDPIHRKYHQNEISFSLTYAFTENFMLPLSHDEVVYGKKSLLNKMPGDEWQRFANLRLLYGYMFTHPGTKLMFMGGEIGQYEEWHFDKSLDWNLLEYAPHQNMKKYVAALNKMYKTTPALFEKGFEADGFEWISYDDSENSVLSYIRKGKNALEDVLVVCNFTPNTLKNYKLGMPRKGKIKEIFNSDYKDFGGSGLVNSRQINIKKIAWQGRTHSADINIPPLGISIFKFK